MKKIFPIQWCRNEHVFHRGYSDHCYTAQWEACPLLRAALIQLEPAYCPGRSSPKPRSAHPCGVHLPELCGVLVHLTSSLSPRIPCGRERLSGIALEAEEHQNTSLRGVLE